MSDFLPRPDSPVSYGNGESWVVVEDDDQVALYRRVWRNLCKPGRVLAWSALPGKARSIERLVVYFHANTHSGFRKADRLEHDLRPLRRLQSLAVPVRFASTLSPDQLPGSLRRLDFDVTSDGKTACRLPPGRVFPGIQSLNCHGGELRFEARAFPDLRELSSRLDARRSLLEVVVAYPSLDYLYVGPIKEPASVARLAPCSIGHLRLETGSLPTLDGVEQIPGLRALALKSLTGLVDVSALRRCESLEFLEITWCSKWENDRPLLEIPNLKSLFTFQNRRHDGKACEAALRAARPGVAVRAW